MKANRKLLSLIFAFVLFSSGVSFSSAQTTNAIITVITGVTDISHYPDDQSLLPGKGPMQSWADFPKIWA
ncbi:MAG TPA: hypothetical protein VH255_00310, partial [Verrucomicrobiae bacterium]|nr:hypothetical protein [Verrucomicrobiae bacterium]